MKDGISREEKESIESYIENQYQKNTLLESRKLSKDKGSREIKRYAGP